MTDWEKLFIGRKAKYNQFFVTITYMDMYHASFSYDNPELAKAITGTTDITQLALLDPLTEVKPSIRERAAIAAMQGILASKRSSDERSTLRGYASIRCYADNITEDCVIYADALIKHLTGETK